MANSSNGIEVQLSASLGNLGQQLQQAQLLVQNTTNHIQHTVQNTQFNFNITNIEQNLNQVSDTAERSFGRIGANLASILAQGFAVGGLVAYTKEVVHAGSEISKFAKLVGSSTDQLQYYAKGAETVGISLEKFADINKDVLDRFGEARRGEGEMMDFFNKIAPKVGITIEQFKGLSGPEALQLYYKGLEKANLSHAEIVTYMEQIANDASLLAPLLEKNGAGFKEWGDKAKAANAIMSQDMVASLNLAKNSLYELSLKWEGLKNTLVSSIAPSLSKISQNFDNLKGVIAAVATVIGIQLAMRLGAMTVEFVKGIAQTVALQIQLAALQAQAAGTSVTLGVLQAASSALGGPVGLAMLALQGVAAAGAFLYMKKASDTATPALDTQKKSVIELRQEYDKLDESQRRITLRDATKEHEKATVAYRNQKNEMLGLIDAIKQGSNASDVDREKVKSLFEQYKAGKITSEQLANGINKLKTVKTELKTSIDQQVVAVKNEALALSETERVLKAYGVAVESNIALNNELAKSHEKVAEQTAKESFEQERLKGIKEKTAPKNLEADFIVKNTQILGGDKDAYEKAVAMKDFMNENNIPLTQVMSPDIRKAFEEMYAWKKKESDLSDKVKKDDQEKTARIKKQAEEAAKLQKILEVNSRVKTNALKHNFSGLENQHALPSGLLSAIHMQESRGNEKVTGPQTKYGTAKGGFQFLDGTAKAYKVSNPYDMSQAAPAAAKYLRHLLDMFHGDLEKAVRAYHAGEGNVQKGKGMGPINNQYWSNIKGYMAGANGVEKGTSSTDYEKSLQDQAKAGEQAEKQKIELKIKYATEEVKIQTELNKALADIDKSKLSDAEKIAYRLQAEKEANDKIIAFRTEQFEKIKVIDEAEIEYNLRQAQRLYDVEKENLEAELNAKKITNVDKIKLEKQLEDQLYEIKRDALVRQLDLENQKTAISGKPGNQNQLSSDLGDLDSKKQVSDLQSPNTLKDAELTDFEQRFGGFTSRISGLWDRGIQSMLNGTLTWKSATQAILTDMSSFFIQKVVTEPLREYATGLMRRLMVRLGFIKSETVAETVGQTAQTGAVVSGEAAKTTATGAGALARLGIKAGEAIKSIMMYAWEAMAGAFKAMVSIPYIGPVLAVGAGAAALATVGAIAGKIKSARGGYDIPSGVNPVTQLHEEEMVLPKQHANTIRALGKNGGGSNLQANESPQMGGDTHLHVHAIDAKSVKNFLKKNSREVAQGLKHYNRGFGA